MPPSRFPRLSRCSGHLFWGSMARTANTAIQVVIRSRHGDLAVGRACFSGSALTLLIVIILALTGNL